MDSINSILELRTAKSVRETFNQDGAVLLDIRQGLCFSMNPVGARIWEMLKRECPVSEIVDTLELEFQVSRTQIEPDILGFIENLKERNLVLSGTAAAIKNKTWLSRVRGRLGGL